MILVRAELDEHNDMMIASGGDDTFEVIVSAVEEGDDVSIIHSQSIEEDAHHDDDSSTPLSSSLVDENSIANQYDIHFETFTNDGIDNDDDDHKQQQQQHHTQEKKLFQYTPPTYFQIAAHVQTNLRTGLSYFVVPLSESFAHLPFLECGAIGSTTERLPLVSGVFRHEWII